MKYAFIDRHAVEHPVRRLCAVMAVHPSGYYAWKRQPESARSRQDRLLTPLIRQCWEESGRVYGYRKIRDDLRDLGERCGKHRVARLMRHAGLRSHTGYGRLSAGIAERVRGQFSMGLGRRGGGDLRQQEGSA